MKTNYYITKDGLLRRKENTIYFINKEEKRVLPINKIYSIYAYGNISFTSSVVSYLSKNGITIHFFNQYGFYEGSLYPRETLVSGDIIVKQTEHYINKDKRCYLAKRFVEGATKNILRNLNYYSTSKELSNNIKNIKTEFTKIEKHNTIPQIMAIEGHVREIYYHALDKIFPEKFKMGKRVRRPPNNRTNTLISFGNSLMYSTVLSEIYNTQLTPTISYLHEPFERRFSLSLDISEIFKPIIIDRIIFKLINKRMLKENDFIGVLGNMLLSDTGRKKFLQEYNNRLKITIRHKGLGREVSYQRLIRLELYKIIKHLTNIKQYNPLVMWW